MKRLLAIFIMICLLAGCGSEYDAYVPTGDGFLGNDGNSSQIQTNSNLRLPYDQNSPLHPYTATDLNNRSLLSLVYQGLFAIDDDFEITPMLCRSYSISMDMREWRFYLDDATFSDGQQITVADAVASLNAANEEGFYAGRFQWVQSITAGDDNSVVFSLKTPMNNLPLLLDVPIIKASELETAVPLGTGPYIIEETPTGKQLRRQAAWWCNVTLPVNALTIPLDHGKTQSELWDLYKFSGSSMVCTDTYVDFRSDYELWESENGIFIYLTCNMNSEVFSDPTMRNALTFAIDRDLLVKKYYRGFAHSATLPASPSFPHYSTPLAERYVYQPERFAQAVAETGNTGKSITLIVNPEDPVRARAAKAVAEMLTAGGLNVVIPESSNANYYFRLTEGFYDLALGQTKLSPNMDLSAFFNEEGSLNYGKIADVTMYAQCMDALAHNGNYQSLHKLVMDDGRLCPVLVRSDAIYGRRGYFPGLSPARDSIFHYTLGKSMEDALITEEK